jgi:serine/threonine protein kinase
MFQFVISCWSLIYASVYRITFHSIGFLRQTVFKLRRNRLSYIEKNPTEDIQDFNVPSSYADTSLTIQYQMGLDIIGVGAAGQVYNVDEHTVLKTCRIYEPPSSNATPRAQWDYASETVFHFGLLKDERAVLRLLAERPHPNIIEVIDVDQPEGLYLRKYRQISELTPASQFDRILWYQDILRALLHLHTLGITHSDIRKDNILFDSNDHALLSNFGASCSFGYPNPSLPLLTNGTSETVSDATDRFTMASMIYELETKVRPEISIDSAQRIILPVVQTGNKDLDSLIEKSWRGRFSSTLAMLKDAERISGGKDNRRPTAHLALKTELRERIFSWRNDRVKQYGSVSFCEGFSWNLLNFMSGCVLFSLPTERQIHILAERYGWRSDDERRFSS